MTPAGKDIFYWVALNLLDGVGPIKAGALLEAFGGEPARIFRGGAAELEKVSRLTAADRREIAEFDLAAAEAEIARAEKHRFKIVTLADRDYPPLLARIPDPPPLLYLKGTILPRDARALAIVGCRMPSPYGTVQAERFAAGAAAEGATVVSGLARGIDTAAHRGALRAGGRTLAVLGSGLLTVYPPENRRLAEEISERGALVSEYPLARRPDRTTFPRRNRIVSGLAPGLLIIEAGPRSGALITAGLALDQGREIFALPGPVDSEASLGTNALISQGAQPALDPAGLCRSLAACWPDPEGSAGPRPGVRPPAAPEPRDEDESRALELLARAGEATAAELARAAGLSLASAVALLSRLELAGLVAAAPGGKYRPAGGRD